MKLYIFFPKSQSLIYKVYQYLLLILYCLIYKCLYNKNIKNLLTFDAKSQSKTHANSIYQRY